MCMCDYNCITIFADIKWMSLQIHIPNKVIFGSETIIECQEISVSKRYQKYSDATKYFTQTNKKKKHIPDTKD